jgi:signal transduction histidine kinase
LTEPSSQALARSVFLNGLAFLAVMVALSLTIAFYLFQVAASSTYIVGTLERQARATWTVAALDRVANARHELVLHGDRATYLVAYQELAAAAAELGKGQPWAGGPNAPAAAAGKVRQAAEAWHQATLAARPADGPDALERSTRDALGAYQAAELAEARQAAARVDGQIRAASGLGFLRAVLAIAFFVLLGMRQYRLLSRAFDGYKAQVDTLARELAARNEELELRVAERTQQLAEARDAAQRANDAKSGFLANFSHELRTPLNAILGFSEMLIEDADPAVVSDVRKIHVAGRHLLGLIDDVLDFSKIEAGKMEVLLEPVDLHALVAEVQDTIGPLARKGRNTLVVDMAAPARAVVITDVKKLRQCIFNLMANACKFTEAGRVELAVRLEQGQVLVCRVADTGIGMTPLQVGKLFQAFNQADASITRKYGGTGLGLAISQRFCRMLGGQIEVESELGVGTTFTLRIPVDAVVAEPSGMLGLSADRH